MTKTILLSRGKVAFVDDTDYERVNAYKWSLDGNGYACRMESYFVDGKRRRRKVMLHRFILNAPDGCQIDHANHDLLDNRRANIRLVTHAQNRHNSRPKHGGSSQYKGVHYHRRDGTWVAQINCATWPKHLGTFRTEDDAARAYDKAAYAAWGSFAYLNFPHELNP